MPFLDLDSIEEKEIVPGYRARFVHSPGMTMAFWTIDAGAELPAHSHMHEQVAMVTSGKFELTVDGKAEVLETGRVAVIPSNATHSGKAITDCTIIDAFHPVLEDYL